MARTTPYKYEPLRRYLAECPGDRVTLTFAEIEGIIGAPLPVSARAPTFWANARGQQPMQMQAWWSAGWRVVGTTVKAAAPSVTFARR